MALFNGHPFAEVSDAPAVFLVIDSSTQITVDVIDECDVATSIFTLTRLEPGIYSVFVLAEAGVPDNRESGGDFFSRLSALNPNVTITADAPQVERYLAAVRVFHLTSPVDNQEFRTGVSDPTETLPASDVSLQARF